MKYSCDFCRDRFDTEEECLEHEYTHKLHKFFDAHGYTDKNGSERVGVSIKDTIESMDIKEPHIVRRYCDLEIHFKDEDTKKAFDLLFDTVMCELTSEVEDTRNRLDSFLEALKKINGKLELCDYAEYLNSRNPYGTLAEVLKSPNFVQEEKCE